MENPADQEPDVAVIIVAYRSANHLRRGLPALLRDPSVSRVVVVDNSAERESGDVCSDMSDRYPTGRLLYIASQNIGFARACNAGAALCAEPFLLFANPDVRLFREIGSLRDPLLVGRAAISAGLLVTPPDGTNIKPLASPWSELLRSLVGAQRSYRMSPKLKEDGWVRAPQLDGAFLLLHQDVWQYLGGFDEQFELYYEDVDLCRRSIPIGGCVADSTEPYGEHASGASYKMGRSQAYTAMRVSRVRYLRKHFGKVGTGCAGIVAAVEWLTRGLTRQPEGALARRAGLRAQVTELRQPNSVWVLLDSCDPP